MGEEETAGNCGRCAAPLHGHLGVFEAEAGGVSFVIIKETSPRNWICCDACGRMLCHACCTHPESGYCDTCIARYGMAIQPPRAHEEQSQPPIL